jgi:DNA sulfur modification protein DndD
LDQEIGALKREMSALESQMNQKNTELTKLARQWHQAKPSLRRFMRALKVASMVDEIVAKAVPSQIEAIAAAMTRAHRSMAHKKDLVERIVIDENCDVKLLNADGMDLRGYDLSAGEKQIFTQALIAAVASVSGRRFPMVVDTPLGRLDIEHRMGVLRHLAQREHQVILLSTNTEVVGEYLHEIAPHVQKKYLAHFERVGDIGQSTVRPGYFDEAEVRLWACHWSKSQAQTSEPTSRATRSKPPSWDVLGCASATCPPDWLSRARLRQASRPNELKMVSNPARRSRAILSSAPARHFPCGSR